jgi:hypothetical protein
MIVPTLNPAAVMTASASAWGFPMTLGIFVFATGMVLVLVEVATDVVD